MQRFLFFCLVISLLLSPIAVAQGATPAPGKTAILANPDDPYYTLAEEIAQREALPVLHSLDEVLAQNPVFLLWVVSPPRLSDQAMIEFGLAMRDRNKSISTGIISGSTLEQARDLWQRGPQVQGRRAFAVNNVNPTAGIYEGRVIAFDESAISLESLTRTSLKQALQNADYLTLNVYCSG